MDLVGDERVLWRGRPSWRSMLGFYLRWGAVALVIGVGAQLLSSLAGFHPVGTRWAWLVAAALVVLTLLVGSVRRIDTLYTVTDRRIHVREGILNRRDHSTHLERIQNVNWSQNLLERVFNVGDVDFDTAGGDDYEFRFAGVADPGALVRLVASVERAPVAAQPGGI